MDQPESYNFYKLSLSLSLSGKLFRFTLQTLSLSLSLSLESSFVLPSYKYDTPPFELLAVNKFLEEEGSVYWLNAYFISLIGAIRKKNAVPHPVLHGPDP